MVGWGMYAPERVLTNDDLARMVDTTDEWIRSRTGIGERHIAADGEATSHMAVQAARAALQVADVNPRSIDLIIVATVTPDYLMPSTACLVQNALNAVRAGAFDLNAGCSGFVYALVMGQQAIASGECNLVLVIGADALSRVVDWNDRATCVLFGDGAGAVVLRASEGPNGVLATELGADGSGGEVLMIPAGGSARPASHETVDQRLHYLRMDGRQVFRFATQVVPQSVTAVLKKAHVAVRDVAMIIPHQANARIIEAVAKRLGLPAERFYLNLDRYGNTSAASVPIALCEAIAAQRISPGQHIVLGGFGSGLTWAAALVRWGVSPERPKAPALHTWRRWLLYRWAGGRTWLQRARRAVLVWLIRITERRVRR
ncbi:MAG: beta-ketoacyl-ACP synthase III [Chloroflexota bacterium]